jgi:uncharacterized membrane protein
VTRYTIGLVLLAALFVAAGVAHFTRAEFYEKAMPDYLPAHAELVAISGVFEILGGLGILLPRTRRAAAWGLIALLVAVFPANLHMALNAERFPNIPEWALWVRLPLQIPLILWALRYTKPRAV